MPATVGPEIVGNDDVAGLQGRHQDVVDVGAEALAIDRAVEDPRCGQPRDPQVPSVEERAAILPEKRGSPEAPPSCCSGRRRLPGPSPGGKRSPMSPAALRPSGPLIGKIRTWSLGGSCRSISTVPTRWRSRTSSSTTSGTVATPTATHATGTSGWPASSMPGPVGASHRSVQFLVLPSSSVGEESLSPNHPDTSSLF